MKFTGIVASLAVASSASALAIPQTSVNAVLYKLNGALANVEGLVGGLLGGVCQEVDLTQVQTELVDIKGQLIKLVPVSVPTKRDIMGTANDVATPATTVAGSEVNTVKNTAGGAVGTVENTAGPVVANVKNVAGGAVGTVENTAAPVVANVKNIAGGAVGTIENTAAPVVANVKNIAGGAVGNVENTAGGLVGNVKNIASGSVDTVTGTVGVNTLAQNLVSKVKSGALDAAGLENVLNTSGLPSSSITAILAQLM
ncbi:hypothetical protein CDV55_105857 [Aspergillus turcosus]|nr:hypothetical protein CDV55_105857 [Aspergillus turcosus]